MFYQQSLQIRNVSAETDQVRQAHFNLAQLQEKLDFSEIKLNNEERLAEERKKQREAVERIKKQTETEIDFLQSRYNYNLRLVSMGLLHFLL